MRFVSQFSNIKVTMTMRPLLDGNSDAQPLHQYATKSEADLSMFSVFG